MGAWVRVRGASTYERRQRNARQVHSRVTSGSEVERMTRGEQNGTGGHKRFGMDRSSGALMERKPSVGTSTQMPGNCTSLWSGSRGCL